MSAPTEVPSAPRATRRLVAAAAPLLRLALAVPLVACDGGPCPTTRCTTGEGALTLHVVDASGAPAFGATFHEQESGAPLWAQCVDASDGSGDGGPHYAGDDGGVPCAVWRFSFEGTRHIVVDAPGFRSATVTVTLPASACCQPGATAEQSVALAK